MHSGMVQSAEYIVHLVMSSFEEITACIFPT